MQFLLLLCSSSWQKPHIACVVPHHGWLLELVAIVQSSPAVVMETSEEASIPHQGTAAPAIAVQHSLQDTHAAATAFERMPALLAQVAEQLSVVDAQEAVSSGAGQDQGLVLAAQAAELASARQAMQLMAQLLESMPQPTEQPEGLPAGQAAVSASDVQALLSQLLQSPPGATQQQVVDQDQSQMIAAQAAELASARQAMQLLAQLLEQEAGSTAVSTSAVQASGQSTSASVSELRLQQGLEDIMQRLSTHQVMHVCYIAPHVSVKPITYQKVIWLMRYQQTGSASTCDCQPHLRIWYSMCMSAH